jgi:hypothetical protein
MFFGHDQINGPGLEGWYVSNSRSVFPQSPDEMIPSLRLITDADGELWVRMHAAGVLRYHHGNRESATLIVDKSPLHSLTAWQHTGTLTPDMKRATLTTILCLALPVFGQQMPPSPTSVRLHYALLNDTSGRTLWSNGIRQQVKLEDGFLSEVIKPGADVGSLDKLATATGGHVYFIPKKADSFDLLYFGQL